MTANEMKYNFLLFYDKLFEYAAPSYDDRQVSAIPEIPGVQLQAGNQQRAVHLHKSRTLPT